MSISLVVFSKLPDCNDAKTRLRSPDCLSDLEATALHNAFVQDTLRLAHAANIDDVYCYWYPQVDEKLLREHELHSLASAHFDQTGSTFAERFKNALQDSFLHTDSAVILIGTDCPYLTPEHLRHAADLLQQGQPVIGPVTGGGFYLLGLPYELRSARVSGCFEENDEVEALKRILAPHSPALLPFLHDVDVPCDYQRLRTWAQLQHNLSDPLAYRPAHSIAFFTTTP